MKFVSFVTVLTAAWSLLPVLVHAAPPPNDNFASRVVYTAPEFSTAPVIIDDATREGLEPQDTGNQTAWFAWVAPADGIVTMTTDNSTVSTVLTVFNGNDLASLAEIARNSDGTDSQLTFFVKAGFAYQICVGCNYSDSTGTVQLNLVNKATTITAPVVVASAAGANDNFASFVTLGGPNVSAFTYPAVDTREGLEPSYTGGHTAWWLWIAPADAQVTMNTVGSDFGTRLSVLNGPSLAALTLVAYGDDGTTSRVTFPAKAGTGYLVCVGSFYEDAGINTVLNITTAPLGITAPVTVESQASANDNFAAAQDLGSFPTVAGFGFNADATTETLESANDGTKTLWWTWTAPEDGTLAMSAAGTTFNHVLVAYAGPGLTALQGLAGAYGDGSNNPATGTFDVSAGATYHFVIGSRYGDAGTDVLNLVFSPGLAHVTVAANVKTLHYSQTHVATFTLTRTGDLSKRLTIPVKIKLGSAFGSQVFTGKAKLKANHATGALRFTLSYLNAPVATCKVFLLPGSGYVLASPPTAKAKFEDN